MTKRPAFEIDDDVPLPERDPNYLHQVDGLIIQNIKDSYKTGFKQTRRSLIIDQLKQHELGNVVELESHIRRIERHLNKLHLI
jgi:hypothetical protein